MHGAFHLKVVPLSAELLDSSVDVLDLDVNSCTKAGDLQGKGRGAYVEVLGEPFWQLAMPQASLLS